MASSTGAEYLRKTTLCWPNSYKKASTYIDGSGYNGRLDGNNGRDVNGLKFCFPMRLALMLACLMEEIVCGVGMEKDTLSVELNNVTDGVVAVS